MVALKGKAGLLCIFGEVSQVYLSGNGNDKGDGRGQKTNGNGLKIVVSGDSTVGLAVAMGVDLGGCFVVLWGN
ncbi:hypothetical protein CFP56_018068 [Quercus suber]|uniref:Uncharacterized protein n=1 Tax=Quercus suber TaxID=58331 RepID=A0AAW0KL63_QUESU